MHFPKKWSLVWHLAVLLVLAFPAMNGLQAAPMSANEVELMVRGGFSNDEIAAEVKSKKMLEPLSPAARKRMRELGSTDALFAVCDASLVDSQGASRAVADQQTRDQKTEAGRKMQADQIAAAPKGGPAPAFLTSWQGDLVTVKEGKVQPFTGSLGKKKYIAVYFSASWCGPCRKFTPTLVQVYGEMRKHTDDFEIVFVSHDRDEKSMIEYMTADGMQWPAIRFDKISDGHPLSKYSGTGIPDLVLLDSEGKVLADSYVAGKYVGPMTVLKDLAQREGFKTD